MLTIRMTLAGPDNLILLPSLVSTLAGKPTAEMLTPSGSMMLRLDLVEWDVAAPHHPEPPQLGRQLRVAASHLLSLRGQALPFGQQLQGRQALRALPRLNTVSVEAKVGLGRLYALLVQHVRTRTHITLNACKLRKEQIE